MKRLIGVCFLCLILAVSAIGQHRPVGGLLCPGNCVQGICDVCGDCSGGFALEALPDESFSWIDAIRLIWLPRV